MIKDYEECLKGYFDEQFIKNAKALSPTAEIIEAVVDKMGMYTENILEIGTSKGYSAGYYRFVIPNSMVITVDVISTIESFKIAEVFKNIIVMNATSDSFRKFYPGFDAIMIDGDHKYYSCLRDYENALRIIKKGGLIFMDNLNHGEQCGRVFEECELKKEVICGTMGVIYT